ncbi:protein-S-isoprenylcysteine O-methyltransferase-like [Armigeres subalbatus]|uniref:protein-S-isoprenylcysteine O-methyltransferase-like n=1 Tax=Armigeres subalbatus TaxID=124917 RepID=UPI002ED17C45
MLCYEGKLSLYCFVSAVFSLALQWVFFELDVFAGDVGFWVKAGFLGAYYLVLNVAIRLKFVTKDYQIAVRATFLGAVFSLGVLIFQNCPEEYKSFGVYVTLMSVFHYSEYLGIAFCNPKTLSPDSFILNHSLHYALAAAASWVEYFIEVYFFPAGLLAAAGQRDAGDCARSEMMVFLGIVVHHVELTAWGDEIFTCG